MNPLPVSLKSSVIGNSLLNHQHQRFAKGESRAFLFEEPWASGVCAVRLGLVARHETDKELTRFDAVKNGLADKGIGGLSCHNFKTALLEKLNETTYGFCVRKSMRKKDRILGRKCLLDFPPL